MEERELPVGWVVAPIGELCDLRNGRAFKPAEWTDEGIPIVRIQNLNNWQAKFNHYQGEVDANHLLGGGELLFAWSGTPGTSFGAHIWAGGKAALNQHIFRVDFDEDSLQKGFFRYAINQKLNDLIDIAHGGVGLRHVTKGKFEQTEVFLPPLNEQRRLAAKLDTTLAAVDACRQRLDGVAAILKRFRQAVLAAAASGELTREWREENGAPEWTIEKASTICAKVQSGGTPKEGFIDEPGVPFLKVYNLVNQQVDFDYKPQFVRPETHLGPLAKSRVLPGDVLINIVGPPLGKVAVAPDAYDEWNINQAITLFRPSDRITSKWIYCLLCEGAAIREIELRTKGSAGQINISLSQCRGFEFLVPSLQEQDEIISRVEALFTLADRLEAKLTVARKIVDRLTPALLAKAFRGELVPQDPGDEPASVLLERIRAARQVEAGAGKPSRRGRRKAATNPDQIAMEAAPVPLDFLARLLRECGALSERALLAVSELEPQRFQQQLYRELESGTAREVQENGQVLLEAVG
jgi:type I restriction enzyme S subunit